jgi:hypothetical protein
MHGLSGSTTRRRVIRAEFFVGAAGCLALGVLTFLAAEGWGRALGVWLIGIGANRSRSSCRPPADAKDETVGPCPWHRSRRQVGSSSEPL